MPLTEDQVFGSIAGAVFADAIGSRFEGIPLSQLRTSFHDKSAVLHTALARDSLRYTDDGQMTLAVAEYLSETSTINSDELMRRFVEVYESWRGYGRGARALIEAYRDNVGYEHLAEHLFPGGSLGNGAAMRSAPVGLRFHGDDARIWAEAEQSARPTHRHELGIEGAQLIALAASFAGSASEVNPARLAEHLMPFCKTTVFKNRLGRLAEVKHDTEIEQFGNGIEAHESVVTALACFALHPDSYADAIATAIWQAGDTDTIAAMTGALVGAHVGSGFTGDLPLNRLEDGSKFVDYLHELSERFYESIKH